MDIQNEEISFKRYRASYERAINSSISFEESQEIVMNYCFLFADFKPELVHNATLLKNSKDEIIDAYHVYYLIGLRDKRITVDDISNTYMVFLHLQKFVSAHEYCIINTFSKLVDMYGKMRKKRFEAEFPDLISISKAILYDTSIQRASDVISDMDVYIKMMKAKYLKKQ